MTENENLVKRTHYYDPNLKVWSGIKTEFPFPKDVSLGSVILEALLNQPEKIAQICDHNGNQYTNKEIAQKAISASKYFNKLGLEQGDVVGFCATNTDFVAPLIYGAFLNGIIVSTLDPSFEKCAIKHIYAITRPKILFCDKANYKRMAESVLEIGLHSPIYIMDEMVENVHHVMEFLQQSDDVNCSEYIPVPLKVSNDKHPAFVLCSSGTTGLSKGISVSHAALLALKSNSFFQEFDIILSVSSLYWTSASIAIVIGPFFGITRLMTNKKFSAEHFLDLLEKYKVQVTFATPPQLTQLVASPALHSKRDFQSLRLFLSSGCNLPMSIVNRIKPFMPNMVFSYGYGLTELPGVGVAAGAFKGNDNNGPLSPNVELKILNSNGTNLGPGEQGEICVRKNLPFIGYYGNPEASKQICDEEGWIHTGDIGYMNEDGELFVISRLKEMLKYNDYKYSPSEIETVIMDLPQVAETCVVGIPDNNLNEKPAAMIVLKPNTIISKDDIYEHVASRLECHKHLSGGVYFVDSIPKTPCGKNIRYEAAKICKTLQNSQKE